MPGLSVAWGKFLAEASAVCLECQNHPKGVELKVYGLFPTAFRVYWENEVTEQVLNAWADERDVTEFGACGIAILVLLELTEFTVIRKARNGTGIDYWLGHKDAQGPFQDAARLEVSGLLNGDDSAVRSRINKKKRQTELSEGKLPAYVAVVEFSRPLSHLVQK